MNASEVLERFGGLPFTLEVELGSLSMPIREIFNLKKGAVISTGRPSGAPFTLRAGGEEIAEVELVAVGDSLSIRIVNLLQQPQSTPGANGTN